MHREKPGWEESGLRGLRADALVARGPSWTRGSLATASSAPVPLLYPGAFCTVPHTQPLRFPEVRTASPGAETGLTRACPLPASPSEGPRVRVPGPRVQEADGLTGRPGPQRAGAELTPGSVHLAAPVHLSSEASWARGPQALGPETVGCHAGEVPGLSGALRFLPNGHSGAGKAVAGVGQALAWSRSRHRRRLRACLSLVPHEGTSAEAGGRRVWAG